MTIFRSLFAVLVLVVGVLMSGCVAEKLPQDQAQRADRIGPLQIHIHADYNVFPQRGRLGTEGALEAAPDGATTQPADVGVDRAERVATITHNTTTMTVHVSTQGSSTQAQTATGGSPGPVNNTPSVSVPVSVTPVP